MGAEAAGSHLLWHKVVCRAPAGTVTPGRPAYAHLLCFSRALRLEPKHSTADVLPRLGEMTWARAMGVEACVAACRFLAAHAGCRVIVDPFCGLGTAPPAVRVRKSGTGAVASIWPLAPTAMGAAIIRPSSAM